MGEVAALNTAWRKFKEASEIASTVYWNEGFSRYNYPTKTVFDYGWQAAMQYVEQQKKEGKA